MSNPILQQMSQSTKPRMSNNPFQALQRFQQFRRDMAGKNPHQIVDQLVASGQMTEEQRNGLLQQAKSMLSMFRGR